MMRISILMFFSSNKNRVFGSFVFIGKVSAINVKWFAQTESENESLREFIFPSQLSAVKTSKKHSFNGIQNTQDFITEHGNLKSNQIL